MRDRFADRFGEAADPLAAMASLVDVMLVFACSLIAALVAGALVIAPGLDGGEPVEKRREIADVPEGLSQGGAGEGFWPVGRVYREPESGKLFLIEGGAP